MYRACDGIVRARYQIRPNHLGRHPIRTRVFQSRTAGFGRVGACHASPPENGLEERIVLLRFDESRAGDVKVDVRVPAADLRRPSIVRIS